MPWWVRKIQKWFWYRHGKVRFRIWIDEDRYIVSASNGDITVYDCYGSTSEIAKEVALIKLQQALNVEENEYKLNSKRNEHFLYRSKQK